MKSYEEVTKSVLERSKQIAAQKSKIQGRIIKAVRASAICLLLAGALVFGNRINSSPGSDILLTPNGSPPTLAADNTELSVVYTETNPAEITVDKSSDTASENADGPFMTAVSLNRLTENDPEEGSQVHYPTMIFNYECEHTNLNSDPKIPPQNGTVHVTHALFDAIKRYGDLDEYGCCENKYIVVIDYYVDGKHINPTEELFESERVRLQKLLGDISGFSFETMGCNSGGTEYYDIQAFLTKSQIGCIAADESFGCVIYLRDNYYKINGILPNNNPYYSDDILHAYEDYTIGLTKNNIFVEMSLDSFADEYKESGYDNPFAFCSYLLEKALENQG